MKKIKWICALLFVILLLMCNQLYYLASLQFKCTDKINRGEDLNLYEIASALQTHTAFWLFGWTVSLPTAVSCFEKQFNMQRPLFDPEIKDNELVIEAKKKLKTQKSGKIRLAWSKYTDATSIYLNGAYISYYVDDGRPYYLYEVPLDYKPGIIEINGIMNQYSIRQNKDDGTIEVYDDWDFSGINLLEIGQESPRIRIVGKPDTIQVGNVEGMIYPNSIYTDHSRYYYSSHPIPVNRNGYDKDGNVSL